MCERGRWMRLSFLIRSHVHALRPLWLLLPMALNQLLVTMSMKWNSLTKEGAFPEFHSLSLAYPT